MTPILEHPAPSTSPRDQTRRLRPTYPSQATLGGSLAACWDHSWTNRRPRHPTPPISGQLRHRPSPTAKASAAIETSPSSAATSKQWCCLTGFAERQPGLENGSPSTTFTRSAGGPELVPGRFPHLSPAVRRRQARPPTFAANSGHQDERHSVVHQWFTSWRRLVVHNRPPLAGSLARSKFYNSSPGSPVPATAWF